MSIPWETTQRHSSEMIIRLIVHVPLSCLLMCTVYCCLPKRCSYSISLCNGMPLRKHCALFSVISTRSTSLSSVGNKRIIHHCCNDDAGGASVCDAGVGCDVDGPLCENTLPLACSRISVNLVISGTNVPRMEAGDGDGKGDRKSEVAER